MRYILFVILIFGLIGCDEYSNYQIIIDNRTNEKIKIKFSGKTAYVNGTDSVLVNPLTHNIYYNSDGRKMKNWNCSPQINAEEVIIEITKNKTLKKDITKEENWTCETNDKNTLWKLTFKIIVVR